MDPSRFHDLPRRAVMRSTTAFARFDRDRGLVFALHLVPTVFIGNKFDDSPLPLPREERLGRAPMEKQPRPQAEHGSGFAAEWGNDHWFR